MGSQATWDGQEPIAIVGLGKYFNHHYLLCLLAEDVNFLEHQVVVCQDMSEIPETFGIL